MPNNIPRTAASLAAMLPEGVPPEVTAALAALNPQNIIDEHPLHYDAGIAFELACRLVEQTQGTDLAPHALALSKWTHLCCTSNTIADTVATDMDIVGDLLEAMLPMTTWDLVPYTFLYEAYVKHMSRLGCLDRALGRNAFLTVVRAVVKDMPDWYAMGSSDNNVYVSNRMCDDDPIIDAFGMRSWYDTCKTSFHRGLVRTSNADG